jgi:hypothetical protein
MERCSRLLSIPPTPNDLQGRRIRKQTWAGEDFIAAWMDSSNGVDMQEVVGGIRLK